MNNKEIECIDSSKKQGMLPTIQKKLVIDSGMVYFYTKNTQELCQDKVSLSQNQMMSG